MSRSNQLLDPEFSLGYQVRRCHRRFDRLLNTYLAKDEIGSGFWYYLRVLWQEDGVTQKHLSDVLYVAENSTVVTIAAMEKRGLVRRVKDSLDRRKIKVTLTKQARALESRLMPQAKKINRIAMEGIEPEHVSICLDVLRRASDNLAKELNEK